MNYDKTNVSVTPDTGIPGGVLQSGEPELCKGILRRIASGVYRGICVGRKAFSERLEADPETDPRGGGSRGRNRRVMS